ncbi:LysR substrate-binding domain-containing protein [Phenylobacterium aquaticum]|uniref:LysR substrate-binding domain-containing protein n=1 Tax=Phenylobacterium aquaticum TaxID=1763816 RepID=UPI001F5D3D3A|nr:LysR substrate-binding domain-containing protein [Phenylobacterium aquaticum]MCI3132393.1 LysR substrate-binding domain-containing protein [Phenylobacterium aquaticum]
MRMRQVEAFRAVMVSGGVTAAANLLHVSQPSVSRLIADLEREVGFSLFERRGGRVIATAQAEALYEAVQRSFAGLELLDQAARRIRAHPVGTIRVAALSALAGGVLPRAIARFAARYPDITVTVESLGQRGIEDRLFLGQADLGLAVEAPVREGVRSARLVEAEYVCILPFGHRLAERPAVEARDLAGETFIGPMHEADALWFGIDKVLEAHGVEVVRRLETQHAFPAYAFVDAGLGVTVAEPFSAPLFHRLGVAVRRFRPRLAVNFALLEPEIGPTPPVIAEFRDEVRAAASARVAEALALADAYSRV